VARGAAGSGHPVVGAPSNRWDETPLAFVALDPGARATAGEIRDCVYGR